MSKCHIVGNHMSRFSFVNLAMHRIIYFTQQLVTSNITDGSNSVFSGCEL